MTRPFYLVAAMVLLWILGVDSVYAGISTATTLREGSLPDVDAAARAGAAASDVLIPLLTDARTAALGAVPLLAFPLSVAKALLAGTLVLASTLVLVGRPAARTFALQAIAANAVFAVIEFILLRHVRGAWIDAAARAALVIQDPTIPGVSEFIRFWGFWAERIRLAVFELGIPFLAALALTRNRTKLYFAEAAAAAEGAEEEP